MTEEVAVGGPRVDRVVSGREGVGKGVVVRKDVPVGGPVEWEAEETEGVWGGCVVKRVWGLAGVAVPA